MECFLFARPEAGRGMPAINSSTAAAVFGKPYRGCVVILSKQIIIEGQGLLGP